MLEKFEQGVQEPAEKNSGQAKGEQAGSAAESKRPMHAEVQSDEGASGAVAGKRGDTFCEVCATNLSARDRERARRKAWMKNKRSK